MCVSVLAVYFSVNLFFLSSHSLGFVLYIQPWGGDYSWNKSNTHTHIHIHTNTHNHIEGVINGLIPIQNTRITQMYTKVHTNSYKHLKQYRKCERARAWMRVKTTAVIELPSIHYQYRFILIRVAGALEPIRADIGRRQGTPRTGHQSIEGTYWDIQPFMLTFTPMGNLAIN